ncbi:winged helix-turn-helix transcriptional regulator [Chitinophaga arvensicola]|uniref:DNA-binding transcriptional regulator, HxlR family n=1 Tax=Chitinophaga arvensicola TaxID=29529 RepID=A0A1I0RUD0_9BACT|nr:helix-turn-helix domain-containing protein [Chitinophaga arvensicola]SEW44904.1 DNA-binding transcriptional regulator, HxlR family [Chitinophaga arvensicola]
MGNKRKNKDFNPNNCGVTHFLNKLGGKWKVLIIYAISMNCNRFSLLQRGIPSISKQMLVNQLHELEEDGIIERMVFPEVPPRVEYTVTPYGQSLLPLIKIIEQWGRNDMKSDADGIATA